MSFTYQSSSHHFIKLTFRQDRDPTSTTQYQIPKYQILVDTLEDVGWYVTLTILRAEIYGDIHTDSTTELFKNVIFP